MKKALTTITLAATLALGSTFTYAGIIVSDRGGIIVSDKAAPCTTSTADTDGIIVSDILNWLEGIIVSDKSDNDCNATDGIIVSDRDGIIVSD